MKASSENFLISGEEYAIFSLVILTIRPESGYNKTNDNESFWMEFFKSKLCLKTHVIGRLIDVAYSRCPSHSNKVT